MQQLTHLENRSEENRQSGQNKHQNTRQPLLSESKESYYIKG